MKDRASLGLDVSNKLPVAIAIVQRLRASKFWSKKLGASKRVSGEDEEMATSIGVIKKRAKLALEQRGPKSAPLHKWLLNCEILAGPRAVRETDWCGYLETGMPGQTDERVVCYRLGTTTSHLANIIAHNGTGKSTGTGQGTLRNTLSTKNGEIGDFVKDPDHGER